MVEDEVFGMGDDPLAAPTWPALTEDEITRAVVATWGAPEPAGVEWRSPRPLSSTAGVLLADGEQLVVKRMPLRLRDLSALAEEHRFMAHLRARGIPIPEARAVVGAWASPLEPAAAERGGGSEGFVYEVQRVGEGVDRYRDDFSWSPYRDAADAGGAGAMLAQMHLAAAGFVAPARPARPLVSSLHGGVVDAFEWHSAHRPAVARFLADRDWRAEIPDLRVDLRGVEPLWTHGDWHPTNVLWSGHQVSSVFDFGLADRTTAVFDLALAIERFAVDWVSLRDGGPANIAEDQISALISGYRAVRPLSPRERVALPQLLPLAHLGYELSEIDYFRTVANDPRNAEIAYDDWLLGHLHWYETAPGRALRALIADAATA